MLAGRRVVVADLGSGTERNLLPLAAGLVASYARSRPAIAGELDVESHFLERDPARLLPRWPGLGVLGLSCYVWNVQASLRLARAVKERWPRALVVLGGPSAPLFPARVARLLRAEPVVDVLVHHEGELTFAALLEALVAGRGLEEVAGISYRSAAAPGGFVTTAPRPRIDDLDALPSPYLDGTFDALVERARGRISGALVETNRGCPYECTFCEWGNAEKNALRRYDLERVHSELDWISRRGMYYVYLADANFGIFHQRDLAIARRLGELRRGRGAPGFLFANWVKNSHERLIELAEELRSGGIETATTLAAQSYDPETLRLVKRANLPAERREEIREAFDRRGLVTYVELILGLPGETLESFRRGLGLTLTPRLNDRTMLYLCQVIETAELGSPESRERFRLETRLCRQGVHFLPIDQDNAEETIEVVVGTATLPVADWRRAFVHGYLVCALYFYRLAFFLVDGLRRRTGAPAAEILGFVLGQALAGRGDLPVLRSGVERLERHADEILAGGRLLATVDGCGDLGFLPQEALTVHWLLREEGLYAELALLLREFEAARGGAADEGLLADLVRYQRARTPSFAPPASGVLSFDHDLAGWFARRGPGEDAGPARVRSEMRLALPDRVPAGGLERVVSRMRTSMAFLPWDVAPGAAGVPA